MKEDFLSFTPIHLDVYVGKYRGKVHASSFFSNSRCSSYLSDKLNSSPLSKLCPFINNHSLPHRTSVLEWSQKQQHSHPFASRAPWSPALPSPGLYHAEAKPPT